MRTRGLGVSFVAVIAVAASLAACSSSGGGAPAPQGALGTALGMIPDTAGTRTYVEFGRLSAQYAAIGGKLGSQPYGQTYGYGLGEAAPESFLLNRAIGIDPTHADWAVTAGQPPNQGSLIVGASSSALSAKAKSLATSVSTSGSATTYRFAPDLRLDTSSQLAKAFGPDSFAPFNVLQIDGKDVRYSRAATDLDFTDAHSATLADNAQVSAVAGCLGDPLAAVITNQLPVTGGRLSPAQRAKLPPKTVGVAYLGIGVEGAKGSTGHELLCVEAGSGAQANTIAAAIRKAFASGTSVTSQRKWSTMLKDAKVTVDGSLVSVTATPADGTATHLLTGLQTGDLPGLVG